MSLYAKLLKQADPLALAKHSMLNHHVNGMYYLCLHRTPELTIKIYFIREPRNSNSGFLVHPHSHRYAFNTTVLHGELVHVRFARAPGNYWDAFNYDCDSKMHTPQSEPNCGLKMRPQHFRAGGQYSVEPHEIHTLKVSPDGPLVLGLAQFADVQKMTEIYLSPEAKGKIVFPDSARPTPIEYNILRLEVLSLLEGA